MRKKLRRGYTTGTCAAAAAAAASRLLLRGEKAETVNIVLPGGEKAALAPENYFFDGKTARCSVKKDSGDDPDVTGGMNIFASVCKTDGGITVSGGEGVGKITRPGLDMPVGSAAINTVPRMMISEAVRRECGRAGYNGGANVVISVPGGEKTAERTFNPRLGIVGGISILGTTGIVEPMSQKALADTIYLELKMGRAAGRNVAVLTPGNYGERFCKAELGLKNTVLCGNFVGDSIDMASELGFEGILIVSHIGKLSKLASGIMNTHSQYADGRLENIALCAALAGVPEWRSVLECATAREAWEIVRDTETANVMMDRIEMYLKHRTKTDAGAVMYVENDGVIGMTSLAGGLIKQAAEGQ